MSGRRWDIESSVDASRRAGLNWRGDGCTLGVGGAGWSSLASGIKLPKLSPSTELDDCTPDTQKHDDQAASSANWSSSSHVDTESGDICPEQDSQDRLPGSCPPQKSLNSAGALLTSRQLIDNDPYDASPSRVKEWQTLDKC